MALKILAVEKRTAFDAKGYAVEGKIPDDIAKCGGITPGPVKLLTGAQGHGGGYGLTHIEAHESRMKQITALGYKSAHSYVRFILEGYTMVDLQKDGRINLIREDGSNYHHLICQWDEELGVWSVTTAIPKRQARDIKPFWRKE